MFKTTNQLNIMKYSIHPAWNVLFQRERTVWATRDSLGCSNLTDLDMEGADQGISMRKLSPKIRCSLLAHLFFKICPHFLIHIALISPYQFRGMSPSINRFPPFARNPRRTHLRIQRPSHHGQHRATKGGGLRKLSQALLDVVVQGGRLHQCVQV